MMSDEVQSESVMQFPAKKFHGDIHRILISPPMSATPTDARKPCLPKDFKGQGIQVTVYVSEHSEIVERWQFSDTDVRWYRLEAGSERRITLKVERRTATA